MNNWLSLSTRPEKVLVTSLDGHPIDADFRCVLRCIRVLSDKDVPDHHKVFLLMKWFFKGSLVDDGLRLFVEFVKRCRASDEDDDDEPMMDYEQDSDAIYASFMQQYGLDLFDAPFLHWYKFMALLNGLGEGTALRDRMRIRGMDTSRLSMEDKSKVDKAKRSVALEARMSKEEMELQRQLDECLDRGEDPTDIIKKIKEISGE